jgi:hypothetical protein
LDNEVGFRLDQDDASSVLEEDPGLPRIEDDPPPDIDG